MTPEGHRAGVEALVGELAARPLGKLEQEVDIAGVGDHRRHDLDRAGHRRPR